ncbi:TonB-dependent receptor [soil metagenome]
MKLKLTAFIALLISGSYQTSAQTILRDSTKSAIELNEIQITVNKEEETKKRVAQEIEILDRKEIENSQAQSTADLLSKSANIFVQKSQQGGGSPVMRGFEASRILLVIDGVRMNNLIYRSGHLQNIVTTDNSILDRVEVLFGPSSTIYGSDALGGVIHLLTRKPEFSKADSTLLKVNAFSRFGTVNDEATGHVDFNIGKRKFASLTSITVSNFSDLRGGENQNPFYNGTYGERPYYPERINGKDSLVKNEDRYLQVESGFTQYDVLQKFAYQQTDNITHSLNLQFSNSTDVPRYDRLTDPNGAGLRYAEFYYGPQTRLMGAYDFNFFNPSTKIQNIHFGVNYQHVEESRNSRRFGRDNLTHRTEKVDVIGLNADLHKTSGAHTFRIGIDAQLNTLKSTATEEDIVTGESTSLDTRYPDGDNSMNNAAVFFSHTWEIKKELILTDGIRLGYTSLHSTFEDKSFYDFPYDEVSQNNLVYSGSIGLIHSPSDDWKLSFLISSGFRTPNVDDLSKVFESSAGNVIVPNEDLKPEQTITTEIGITRILNGKTRWENTLYYTQFIDAIVTEKFQFNGSDSIIYDGQTSAVNANQNKGKAYIYGFSSEIKTVINEQFNFSFMMNYTYGRIKTDSSDAPLDHIAPFLGRIELGYTNKKFGAGFYINYNGWKKLKDYNGGGEDNQQYATSEGMPAWLTANLRTSYKINKHFTVQAGIENIFDTQYRAFASGINGPGRNLYGTLRFHY